MNRIKQKRISGNIVPPEIKNFCPLNCFILSALSSPLRLGASSPHFISRHCCDGRPPASSAVPPPKIRFSRPLWNSWVSPVARGETQLAKECDNVFWGGGAGGGVGGRTPVDTELLNHVEALGWRFDATPLPPPPPPSFPSRQRDGDSPRLSVTTTGARTCSPCVTAADCHGRRPSPPVTRRGGGVGGGGAEHSFEEPKGHVGARGEELAVKAFQCRVRRSDLNKSAVFFFPFFAQYCEI